VPAHEALAALRPAEPPVAGRPFTYVNMVSSTDGRAGLAGRSSALGGPADLEVLLELRTLADAVLIGVGTLRAEGYDRLVRSPDRRERRRDAGLAEDPLAVVLCRRFDVPWEAGLFASPAQPVLIYTAAADAEPPPDVVAPVEVVTLPDAGAAAALADLRSRGVEALLCEGGPTLNGALLAAGLVDELFVTLAPVLTGDGSEPNIVEGGPLPAVLGLTLRSVFRHGSELYLRYAVEAG